MYQYLSYERALWCSCCYWRSQSLCPHFWHSAQTPPWGFPGQNYKQQALLLWAALSIRHEKPCMCRHTDGSCPPFSSAHADLSSSDDPASSRRPGTPWSNCGTEVSPGWAAIRYLSTHGSCHRRPGSKEKSTRKKRRGSHFLKFVLGCTTAWRLYRHTLVLARLSLENQSKGKTCIIFIILTFHNLELLATLKYLLLIAIFSIFNRLLSLQNVNDC